MMTDPRDPLWIIAMTMLGAGGMALCGQVETALAIDAGAIIVLISRFPWVV
jgi:hypothetical protein